MPQSLSECSKLLGGLNHAVEQMLTDYRDSRFLPLLEDDIVAYLYHRLAAIVKTSDLHVKTRVLGMPGKKLDLVVGPLVSGLSDKGTRRHIQPALAVEVKFLNDDTNQGERQGFFIKVGADIDRLSKLARANPGMTCVVVMADEVGFMLHPRRDARLQMLRERAESFGVRFVLADLRIAVQRIYRNAPVASATSAEQELTRVFKGKPYRLRVFSSGYVQVDGREFSSLTAAAKAVTGYKFISGPAFWGVEVR